MPVDMVVKGNQVWEIFLLYLSVGFTEKGFGGW